MDDCCCIQHGHHTHLRRIQDDHLFLSGDRQLVDRISVADYYRRVLMADRKGVEHHRLWAERMVADYRTSLVGRMGADCRMHYDLPPIDCMRSDRIVAVDR